MESKDSTREQRKRQLGIDCPDKVVWKNWDAGEEYVKKIVIKNVDVRAQSISYRLPERKATFLTPYPEATMLSSGMHMELEIRFCPTEVTEVHDCIEIKVRGRGSFVVYLEALPPHAKLSVPESHDFELCAVSKTYSHKVTVTNTGTVPLSFYWEAPFPFRIEPSRGELDKDQSTEVTLFFTPQDATASICQAVCKMVDIEEVIATIKISGIGKYPFIRFQYHHRTEDDGPSKTGLLPVQKDHAPLVPLNTNTSTISFGDVVAGSVVVSEFYVENPTGVPAEVSVRRVDDNLTGPFKLSPSSAVIPRGGCQKFKVTYRAMSGGSLHINTFELRSTAGNTIFLETRGAGVGPKVKCSTNHIDFGDINLDESPSEKDRTRLVQLTNMSDCVARYQFLNTAPGAAFAVEPCIGSIPAKGKAKVKIIFRPSHAMNYLRRLMILVHNSADALYMDVIGSAYDSFIRPLPFDLSQVEAFYMRLERGLGRITPDELEALATSATRDFPADSEEENNAQSIWRSIDDDLAKGLNRRTGRLSYHHIFVEHNLNAYPFKMDITQVSFGGTQPPAQTVTVSNYTKSMAMASWCVPEGSVYSVTPLQQDVPPNGRADFCIRFHSPLGGRPGGPSAYDVGQYLECFVNFKQMRSFRLCSERSFTPPHCFTVQVNQDRGHTTDPLKGSSGGSAGSLLSADKSLFFPAVRIGDTAYQVLSIENSGDVVMTYENVQMILHEVSEKVADDVTVYETTYNGRTTASNGQDALNAMYRENEKAGGATRSGGPNDIIFTCYPAKGILHPGQHTLMLLKFSPTRYARYRAEAGFRVANMSINDKLSVTMRGESHIPKIKLEEFSQLTFRPTCITGKTNRVLSIINPTCFPVSYQLVASPELNNTVRLHPNSGYLERGERVWVTATFSPMEARVHSGFLSLVAMDESEDGRKIAMSMSNVEEESQLNLREYVTGVPVLGEGMNGIIEVEPIAINCGDISSLEDQTVTLTLYNSGMSEVQFEVRTMTRSLPKEWRHAAKLPRLRNHTGVLPARSHTLVLVTVYPCAGLSDYILYVVMGGVGTNLSVVPSPSSVEEALLHPHCQLTIKGTHPAIQIADARSLSLRRSQIWCQLNINAINQQLSAAVIPSDVQNLGFAFPQNIHNLVPIAVDLGVGCEGSTPMNVSLLIQNTGDCSATFAFWLPMENDVSVEHWFQDDENLKDIQHVVDKNIIEINPAKGEIGVGKSIVVTFTYRFDTVGVHKLPVLLRVNESKKVLLTLEGRTLPPGMEAIAFHHPSAYDLLPVALGDVEPPLQSITIENPLEHEVSFKVDTDALRRVAEENFGFPILQCVNPSGVLAPHSLAQIAWYFRPLEAKEYNIEVPILTAGGEEYSVTFTGCGFHPRKTSMEAQREQMERSFLSIPAVPQLNLVPSLPITLSIDALQLGAVPFFSLHRRMCVLTNHHRQHLYSFHWDARHPTGDHVISISPMSGLLRPGERVHCKIALYSGSTSQIIEWPLTCHITNETLLEQEGHPGVTEQQRNIGAASAASAAAAENLPEHLIAGPRSPVEETIAEHGAAVEQPPFVRSTCTKEYQGGQRKRRKSVTNIPLESLGVRGLTARVKAERRRELEFAAAVEDEASDARSMLYNSLELLLQTRIMPLEDYERLYGSRALNGMYLPVMNVFKDPRADVSDEALGQISKEDASLVRDIMDELLRAVVANPKVKAAFTEPFIRMPVLYQNCAASRVIPRGSVAGIGAAGTAMSERANDAASGERNAPGKQVLNGFMNNALEEALEQLISSAVGSAAAEAQRSLA